MIDKTCKTCKKCTKQLPATLEFFHRSGNYLNSVCKNCRNSEKPIVIDNGLEKVCSDCGKSLPANLQNFHYSKREKDGLRSKCKTCRSRDKKEYRDANRDAINAQSREYSSRPEILNHLKKKRRTEEYRKRKRDREKDLRKIDPKYKLIHGMRNSFNRYIKKNAGTFEYLGIDRDGFLNYIESQLLEGMTWDNYGFVDGDRMAGWHVDHIIPLCSFDFSDPDAAYRAWHYTNLRPLWARDNMSKGGRIV